MKTYLLKNRKGEMSFAVLFLIAVVSVILVSGGAVIDSQYNIFGALVKATPFDNHSTQQLTDLQFITFTPSPIHTTNLTITPTITPGGSNPTTPSTGPSATATPTTQPTSPTSLLCGTNLGLFGDNDWVTDPGAQASLAQLHVSTLRMPWRTDLDPNQTRIIKSVQIAHSKGVIPLVILPSETTYVNQDKQLVTQLNAVMGGGQIFYELGNEVFDSSYLGKWNTIIPQLKPLAVNAWFGGPVAASNDGLGTNPGTVQIANFYVAANPTPDFISWHEYTCGNIVPGTPNYSPTYTTNYCFDHVANSLGTAAGHNWTQHMQDQQAAFKAVGITTMPKIFITEWGYDSVPLGGSTPDPRLAPLTAMHFPKVALTELKNIGVYATYQYVLDTNTDVNLINYNGSQITPYGQDFQSTCAGF